MAKQKNLTLAVAAATSSVYDVVEGNVVFLEEAGLYQASWPKPRSPKKTITRNIPASQVLAATLGEDGSVTFLATSAVVADLGECEITGTTEQGLLIVTDEDGNEHHVNPSALESESESEGEAAPAKAKPKAAGKKKAAEVEDEDDEDDEPAPKAKGKKKAVVEDEDDEDDEDDEPAPKAKGKKKAVVEDDDEDDEPAPKAKGKKKAVVEDDDEDDEPAPKAKGKKKAAAEDLDW